MADPGWGDSDMDMAIALMTLQGYCEMASDTIDSLKEAREKLIAAQEVLKDIGKDLGDGPSA